MKKILELRLVRSIAAMAVSLFIISPLVPQLAVAAGPQTVPTGSSGCTATDSSCLKDNPIIKDINSVVNFLSIGVGIIITAGIIMGGIQYITAGDNEAAVKGAKEKITNAFIALFLFLFMYALLQWLIPGGAFSS